MSLMWGPAAVICPLMYGLIGGIRLPDAARRHSGWITRLGRTNMRQNALLRSGKGLATPGTARKNVAHVAVVKPASAEGREGHFAVRNGVRCAGVHLIVDLHGAEGLDDIGHPYVARLALCRARRVHVRQGHPRRLHSRAAQGLQGQARGSQRNLARAGPLIRRPTAADASAGRAALRHPFVWRI